MDWRRVKTILIALLLVANAVLLAGIYTQFAQRRAAEEHAIEAALGLLEQDFGMTAHMITALPRQLYSYGVERDISGESAFARSLLGGDGFEESDTGGGIYRYKGPLGEGEIRRGGEMEFTISVDEQPGSDEITSLLSSAGLTGISPDGGSLTAASATVFTQLENGYPLINCRITCNWREGRLHIIGRWLISGSWRQQESAPSRAQSLMSLAKALAQIEIEGIEVLGVNIAYSAAGSPGNTALRPVWQVATNTETFNFDLFYGDIIG